MKLRFESWGAWARVGPIDTPLGKTVATVALDRGAVRELGLDGGDVWTGPPRASAPLELHVAVTSHCDAGCTGCYTGATPDGGHVDPRELDAIFEAAASAGVFVVAFGGGEPTSREDLAAIALAARGRGLSPVLTTNGFGLTEARAKELAVFDQVNVSYDGGSGADGDYARVRGFDGARGAELAIQRLSRAGVPVGVNVVLTRRTFDSLERTLARAFELGAVEAQLLRYKPRGHAASLDYQASRLSPPQIERLPASLRAIAGALPSLRMRIDCSLVPFLADATTPEELRRWGIFGCEAGRSLGSTDAGGHLAPCSFLDPGRARAKEGIHTRGSDPAHVGLAEYHAALPEPCASCPVVDTCRGGCQAVSLFASGAYAPDPECPRVRRNTRTPAVGTDAA